jgi:hypothetical protein
LFEGHDVVGRAPAMARPRVHELTPPMKRVGSAVGLLGTIANRVRQRVLGELAREMRFVARPID